MEKGINWSKIYDDTIWDLKYQKNVLDRLNNRWKITSIEKIFWLMWLVSSQVTSLVWINIDFVTKEQKWFLNIAKKVKLNQESLFWWINIWWKVKWRQINNIWLNYWWEVWEQINNVWVNIWNIVWQQKSIVWIDIWENVGIQNQFLWIQRVTGSSFEQTQFLWWVQLGSSEVLWQYQYLWWIQITPMSDWEQEQAFWVQVNWSDVKRWLFNIRWSTI